MAYEFNGKQYEQASTHQKEWGRRLIDELHLRGDERVLDLGCGDGVLTAQIAQLVPRGSVLGIDASSGMIGAARDKTADNLQFMQMDINDLAFDREFDVIFSNATLHWVKDHEQLLHNVHRALVLEGLARFNFAGDGNCMHFYQVIREAMVHDAFAKYLAGFVSPWYMPSVNAYTELARRSGFGSVKVWGENADRYFPDTDSMIRWLDQPSLVPFAPLFPKQIWPVFREFVVTRMIELTRQEDGRCFETFRRINLLARK